MRICSMHARAQALVRTNTTAHKCTLTQECIAACQHLYTNKECACRMACSSDLKNITTPL